VKKTEEANFEFNNLFTSLHSINKSYDCETNEVSLSDFVEYHTILSNFVERDCEFRNYMIGVWSMDIVENV